MKSDDTEEWLDIHFTRPIGLAFALLWHRLGVTPNTITLLSIVLGIAAGAMFYFQNLYYNMCNTLDISKPLRFNRWATRPTHQPAVYERTMLRRFCRRHMVRCYLSCHLATTLAPNNAGNSRTMGPTRISISSHSRHSLSFATKLTGRLL